MNDNRFKDINRRKHDTYYRWGKTVGYLIIHTFMLLIVYSVLNLFTGTADLQQITIGYILFLICKLQAEQIP